jgi:hypothetical protein
MDNPSKTLVGPLCRPLIRIRSIVLACCWVSASSILGHVFHPPVRRRKIPPRVLAQASHCWRFVIQIVSSGVWGETCWSSPVLGRDPGKPQAFSPFWANKQAPIFALVLSGLWAYSGRPASKRGDPHCRCTLAESELTKRPVQWPEISP